MNIFDRVRRSDFGAVEESVPLMSLSHPRAFMDEKQWPDIVNTLHKRMSRLKKQPFNAEAIQRMALSCSLVSSLVSCSVGTCIFQEVHFRICIFKLTKYLSLRAL